MQSLLVVGGYKLGNITKKLEWEGFKEVIHLNGRNRQNDSKGNIKECRFNLSFD
ncbi:hypothetical protein [Peribacillus sp. N1]